MALCILICLKDQGEMRIKVNYKVSVVLKRLFYEERTYNNVRVVLNFWHCAYMTYIATEMYHDK